MALSHEAGEARLPHRVAMPHLTPVGDPCLYPWRSHLAEPVAGPVAEAAADTHNTPSTKKKSTHSSGGEPVAKAAVEPMAKAAVEPMAKGGGGSGG